MKVLYAILILFVLALLWIFAKAITSPYFEGSMRYALKWAELLNSDTNIQHIAAQHPEVRITTLTNGQWIASVAACSHANGVYFGPGGTIVTKDSDGETKAFFGHVCGPSIPRIEGADLSSCYSNLLRNPRRREVTIRN